MRRHTGIQRVGALQARTRQCEIHADLARKPRQEIAASDIRKKSDPGFGHREHRAFVGDAMAAVQRHSNTAAHHDAAHQRDIGFRKMFDRGVQNIFVAIKVERVRRAGSAGFVRARISPPAQNARSPAPRTRTVR